jgi:hypothetical protein
MIGPLLGLALQVQIAAADIAPMLNAALDMVAPASDSIGSPRGARRIGDKRLLLDLRQTGAALHQLDPSLPGALTGLRLDRSYTARERADAFICTARPDGGRTCAIADDGLYVAVASARRGGAPGEYVLDVVVLWSGGIMPWGYQQEVLLQRIDGKWAAVRHGPTKAY